MNRVVLLVIATLALLLAAPIAFASDGDADGIQDSADNCSTVANADQTDSDGDGFGNACDGDYNGDGIVDASDESFLRGVFGSSDGDGRYDASADHDGDGIIAGTDFAAFNSMLGKPPGPSGVAGN